MLKYVRCFGWITKRQKAFLAKGAKAQGMSESAFLRGIINDVVGVK